MLTLALQVAVEAENWDEVDTLIKSREEAIDNCRGLKLEEGLWQQIRTSEAKAFEGLMRQRGSLLASIESGQKAVTMRRAYGSATDSASLADY